MISVRRFEGDDEVHVKVLIRSEVLYQIENECATRKKVKVNG